MTEWHWRSFGEAIFDFVRTVGVSRILFVGSFGGAVPHTREPRLYVTCSDAESLEEMEKYLKARTAYLELVTLQAESKKQEIVEGSSEE